jgi:hypothetical protein
MLKPKSQMSGTAVAVLAALVALGLAACGSDAPSIAGPSAGAPATADATIVLSAAFDDVEAGGQRVIAFNLPFAGALALTVRWNDPDNSVTALLTGADCPDPREAATHCPGLRSVAREGREGREGVIDDQSAGGAYRLLLENEGPGKESIRVTAVLTHSRGAGVPTPYPTSGPSRQH